MYARFTFENFVTGPNSAQAFALAQAAADAPGEPAHSPLYIHGPSSAGKSHLLYAIKNRLSQTAPEKQVACLKYDDFTSELIQSIHCGRTPNFREVYASQDVLLVDDIHFIRGKEATQQEFLTIVELLLRGGKQLVLTSTCPLEELPVLNAALSAAEVAITAPDPETMLTVAAAKATEYGMEIPEVVLRYITHCAENVRQVEGALKRIMAYRDLYAMELTAHNTSIVINITALNIILHNTVKINHNSTGSLRRKFHPD